jgi:LacI family transcriptional regulator
MVTLKDVAAHTGVSISAVSLVLNERDAGRINPDVAARIRQVASDLGYVPNLLARGLKTRHTHTIGLLSDGVASIPFAGQMLAGAQIAAWEEGFLLLLIDTAGRDELEGPAVKALLQRDVEGLILAAEFHRDVDLPLVPRGTPTVVLNGTPTRSDRVADYVVPDETAGAYAATEHLIRAGHRRIAFCNVAGDKFVAAHLRRSGYEAALATWDIPMDPTLVVHASAPSSSAAFEVARELLSRTDRPSAVFCFSDQIALGFYQIAHELGLQVPRDLSVVGFDNQQSVADALLPGLTTIQLPHNEMGKWAAKQAIARVRGDNKDAPPAHSLMPCPLIERQSVASPIA